MQLPAAPSLSIDDQQVTEGDSGTTAATFTVTRSGDTSAASTVTYTVADGTATVADNDYVATTGTLEFTAGETAKTITVDVHGDVNTEPDETFVVSLSNASGATISDPQGTGTIVSDDLPNQPPTANAGPEQTVTDTDGNGSEVVTLQGIGSDVDGTIVSYEWSEGTTALGNTATIAPTLGVGTHTLTLTVTDNEGATGSDTVEITVNDASQPLYVYDIRFESKRRGRDWRAVFEIRTDSNGNGSGDAADQAVAGVAIEVTFAGQTFSGFTDSNGIFRTDWMRNLGGGDHYANAVDVAMTGYNWNKLLLGEDDSDGDGFPDELLPL